MSSQAQASLQDVAYMGEFPLKPVDLPFLRKADIRRSHSQKEQGGNLNKLCEPREKLHQTRIR